MQRFIGGIGCFWDETKYEGIPGIISTECGYCGGKNPTVSYEQVCGGDTEHIEVVKVEFDPKILSYEDVIRLFFKFRVVTPITSSFRLSSDISSTLITSLISSILLIGE